MFGRFHFAFFFCTLSLFSFLFTFKTIFIFILAVTIFFISFAVVLNHLCKYLRLSEKQNIRKLNLFFSPSVVLRESNQTFSFSFVVLEEHQCFMCCSMFLTLMIISIYLTFALQSLLSIYSTLTLPSWFTHRIILLI